MSSTLEQRSRQRRYAHFAAGKLIIWFAIACIFSSLLRVANGDEAMISKNTTTTTTTTGGNSSNGTTTTTTSWQGEVEYSGLDVINTTRLIEEGLAAGVNKTGNNKLADSYYKASGRTLVNFNGLNQVLAPVVIVLPKLEGIGNEDIKLDMRQLVCEQLSVGSIDVGTDRLSSRLVDFNASFEDIAGLCQAQFSFMIWGFIPGDGKVSVKFQNSEGASSVKVRTRMESAYNYGPPTFASTRYCKPQWRLELSLYGSAMADFLDSFNDVVRGAIEDQFNSLVCQELEKIAPSWLTDVWLNLTNELGPYTPCSEGQEQTIVHGNASYTQCTPSETFIATDPLSVETSLVPRVAGSELLNFTDNFIFDWTKPLQKRLGSMVNETLANGSMQADLGINVGVRQLLKGKDALSLSGRFPLFGSGDTMFATEAAITNITIAGLDSFTNFSLMLPFSAWTWGFEFHLRKIKMSVAVELGMQPSSILLQGGAMSNIEVSNLAINNTFTTTVELSGLAFRAAQLLAIDMAWLKQLRVGQLLASPLGCTLRSALVANVTELEVALQDLAQPSVTGVLGVGVDTLLNALIEALFKMLRLPTLSMLPNIVRNVARDALNDWTNSTFTKSMSECLAPVPLSPLPDYFDFGSSILVSTVTAAVKTFLEPTEASFDEFVGNFSSGIDSPSVPTEIRSILALGRNFLGKIEHNASVRDVLSTVGIDSNIVGMDKINTLVGQYTKSMNHEGIPGAIDIDQVFFIRKDLGEFGVFSLNISDLRASGLDSYSEVILSKPTEKYTTTSFFSFGNVTRNPRVQFTLMLNVHGGSLGVISDAFTLSLSVSSLSFLLDVLAMWDQARLNALTMEQLLTPECVLASFREGGLGIKNFSLVLHGIRLGLNCASCSTEYLRSLSQAWNEQDSTEFESWLDDPNVFLANLSAYMQSTQFQQAIDDRILLSAAGCKKKTQALAWSNSSDVDNASMTTQLGQGPGLHLSMSISFFIGFGFVFVSMVGMCKAFKGCIRRERGLQVENDELAFVASQALVNNNCVPLCSRIAVVFLLLVSLALFVFGHLLLVLNIDVRMQLLGKTIPFDGVKINILQGISGMWDSGAYLFFAVITSTCFLWPYMRSLALLSLWCIPPRLLKPRKRGKAFVWLDLMHKWSIFGVLALIMFVVILATSISIQMIFTPLLGLCCNFIGQAVCQAASRMEVYYHQRVVGLTGVGKAKQKTLLSRLPVLLGRHSEESNIGSKPTDSEAEITGTHPDGSHWLACHNSSMPLDDVNITVVVDSASTLPALDRADTSSSYYTQSDSCKGSTSRGHFRLGSADSSQRVNLYACAGIAESDPPSRVPSDAESQQEPVPSNLSSAELLQSMDSPVCGAVIPHAPYTSHTPLDGAGVRVPSGFNLTRNRSISPSVYPPWYSCACTDVNASQSFIPIHGYSAREPVEFKCPGVCTPQSIYPPHTRTPGQLSPAWHTSAAAELPFMFTPSAGSSIRDSLGFQMPGTEAPQNISPTNYDSASSFTLDEGTNTREPALLMLPGLEASASEQPAKYSDTSTATADTPSFTPVDDGNVQDVDALNLATVELSASVEPSQSRSVCSLTCELLTQRKCIWFAVPLVRFAVPAFLILGGLLTVLGFFLPATSVTHSGLVALIVDFQGPGIRTSSFSILELFAKCPEHVNVFPIGQYGVWAMTIILGALIFVVPVLQALLWLVVWAIPLSLTNLQRLLRWSQALAGMSFFEIFLLSFLIVHLQLEGIAFGLLSTLQQGVGAENFGRIQDIVVALHDIGVISPSDATIFGLTADLGHGAYVLLLAAFLLRCGGIFVHSQAFEISTSAVSPKAKSFSG